MPYEIIRNARPWHTRLFTAGSSIAGGCSPEKQPAACAGKPGLKAVALCVAGVGASLQAMKLWTAVLAVLPSEHKASEQEGEILINRSCRHEKENMENLSRQVVNVTTPAITPLP